MKPLIDADMLLYECSAVAEYPKDEPIKGFEFVSTVFENKVRDICEAVGGTEEPLLYITGEGNFRVGLAISAPYKGNRTAAKPFHYHNLKAYIMAKPNCVHVEGMEADDAMVIDQMKSIVDHQNAFPNVDHATLSESVICTRDKDLRMAPGWHYGWECGRQPEYRMRFVDEDGYIELSKDRKKIVGDGLAFFYSQLLTGDKTDNIPGAEGYGPVAAYEALKGCTTEAQLFHNVRTCYIIAHHDTWEARLLEQGRLLWMVRELDEDGKPVMWEFPEEVRAGEDQAIQ